MILGIDPGSKKIGLAVLQIHPRLRVYKSRVLPVKNLTQLGGWIEEASLVVLERPVLKGLLTKGSRNKARTPEGAQYLYDMAALNLIYVQIRQMVIERGVPLLEPVGYYSGYKGERTWLHELTGLRRPTRSDVRAVIKSRFDLPGSLQEDLLDATGLALYGMMIQREEAPIPA